MTPRFISLSVITLVLTLCALSLHGQKSYKDYRRQLRSADNGAQVSIAFRGAKDLSDQQNYKDALALLNRGIKKAKSMGAGPYTVMLVNKADLIATSFPMEESYLKELIESIEEAGKYELPTTLINKSQAALQKIRYQAPASLGPKISTLLKQTDDAMATEQERLAQAQKDIKVKALASLGDEVVYDEMEKLKDERQRLEQLQEHLAKSIEENNKVLRLKARTINKMSQEQAKQEAILQYNKRMIDSLNFMAMMDSIAIQRNELQLSEQASVLALQKSELRLKDSEIALQSSQQKFYITLSVLGLALSGLAGWLFLYQRRTNKSLQLKNQQIETEKERSEELLLNILPKFIAQELKEKSKVQTRLVSQCTVLFSDFINFSQIAKQLEPRDLIEALDECFRAFDTIVSKHNIEKIKTIGDAYMCASGVPVPNKDHAVDAVSAAIEMVAFLDEWNAGREKDGKVRFDARIGIHSGPIIAGVVGMKKFAYDIWGDTVNVAARIEQQSSAQRINISSSTYDLIKNHYSCIKRGSLSVKNMSDLEMYFIDKALPPPGLN